MRSSCRGRPAAPLPVRAGGEEARGRLLGAPGKGPGLARRAGAASGAGPEKAAEVEVEVEVAAAGGSEAAAEAVARRGRTRRKLGRGASMAITCAGKRLMRRTRRQVWRWRRGEGGGAGGGELAGLRRVLGAWGSLLRVLLSGRAAAAAWAACCDRAGAPASTARVRRCVLPCPALPRRPARVLALLLATAGRPP